jgi:hypothetical protein
MDLRSPLVTVLPHPMDVRHRLGDAMREVDLLRRLLVLSERAEQFRQCDRNLTCPEPKRGKKHEAK